MRDIVKVHGNERVDLEDFEHVGDEGLQASFRQVGDSFLTDPLKQTAWVIDGFEIENPVDQQVQVSLGRAILAQREGGQVFSGQIASEGEPTRTIDVNGFADGVWGIYIRFDFIEGDTEGRAFWNATGGGSEFSQSVATRRLANWSMRLDLNNPGSEWFKIGEATVTAGLLAQLRDLRDFFFEGARNFNLTALTPTGTQYASGWSTEGGGSADDRDDDRQQFGVKDLATFVAAMRQSVEDIRGRGLRRWWEKGIGGMNIGFDTDPVEDRLAVGDEELYLDIGDGDTATLTWEEGRNELRLKRQAAGDGFDIFVAASTRGDMSSTGLALYGGLNVGFVGAPVLDRMAVGDAAFNMNLVTSNPHIIFATSGGTDYLQYDRSNNYFNFLIADPTVVSRIKATGIEAVGGLFLGSDISTPQTLQNGTLRLMYTGTHTASTGGIESLAPAGGAYHMVMHGTGIAHGMTAVSPATTCYLDLIKTDDGGAYWESWTESIVAWETQGNYTTGETTTDFSSVGAISFLAMKKNGTGLTSPANGDNIFSIQANTNAYFLVKGNGTIFHLANASDGGSQWSGYFYNDGNNVNREGIAIQCGEDTPAGTNVFVRFLDGNAGDAGGISRVAAGTAAFFAASDARLKTDVRPTKVDALQILDQLPLFEFRKIRKSLDGPIDELAPVTPIGWVAQECMAWEPMVLHDETSGHMAVSDGVLMPLVVRSIQQLNAKIAQLEAQLATR